MKVLYINRDAAVERRRNLEASFAAARSPDSDLIRIPAVEAADVAAEAGVLTPAERACRMSHETALRWPAASGEDVLIVEDDTRFSPAALRLAGPMLAATPACDVVFTEVMPTDFGVLAQFAHRWPELKRTGNFLLHGLGRTGFVGAAAYVVRADAREKLLAALQAPELADKPYDMALVELARSGAIDARVAFPFLTAPSDDADASQIQPGGVDLRQAAMHAFRRLMFVDRDLDRSRDDVARLQAAHGDEAAALAGGVFAAILSEAFPDHW
jgi:GR25 family glycosyltransferase involved in LPS biosynthesis